MRDPAVADYQPPSSGPFKCSHCEYFQSPMTCRKPQVVKEHGATVAADGCCNYYQSIGHRSLEAFAPR